MKKFFLAGLLAVLIIGFAVGWLVHGSNKTSNESTPPQASQTQGVGNQAGKSNLKSLVGYSLPDGWQEASCDGKSDTVYVLPHEVSLNCAADPSAPISIELDQAGATDCSQLDDQTNVRQHVCKSLNIDGRKTLQASTTSSSGKTVANYYMDTGKGIVKVEYNYSGEGTYLDQYNQIAKSLTVK